LARPHPPPKRTDERRREATITFPLATGTAESVKAETDLSYYPVAALVIGIILSALMASRSSWSSENAVSARRQSNPTSNEPQ
jgi:hypothetical protein